MQRHLSVLEHVPLSVLESILPSVRMQREEEVGLVSIVGVVEGCPELLQLIQGQAPDAPLAATALP